uniref:Uncharacterized protein n=1 Tax=Chromera velia CCMP2878 TaxID=1169474 RepID=A0A0G4H2K8_9ALVE|eukprot:Cvel_24446.t1-p1 / transcript=Cvel_24446.t1 / gene=Cvel_24446 / organism=Chromera_velia_CCMP2878 / gene_product=hypothetical protein / transcript_product=hypothetical protein / location=Cvel_scaffold2642:13711-17473(-) / protein_length=274 / sequence_SO=supercontig / SO=protein_coding / is_pseudo=false
MKERENLLKQTLLETNEKRTQCEFKLLELQQTVKSLELQRTRTQDPVPVEIFERALKTLSSRLEGFERTHKELVDERDATRKHQASMWDRCTRLERLARSLSQRAQPAAVDVTDCAEMEELMKTLSLAEKEDSDQRATRLSLSNSLNKASEDRKNLRHSLDESRRRADSYFAENKQLLRTNSDLTEQLKAATSELKRMEELRTAEVAARASSCEDDDVIEAAAPIQKSQSPVEPSDLVDEIPAQIRDTNSLGIDFLSSTRMMKRLPALKLTYEL